MQDQLPADLKLKIYELRDECERNRRTHGQFLAKASEFLQLAGLTEEVRDIAQNFIADLARNSAGILPDFANLSKLNEAARPAARSPEIVLQAVGVMKSYKDAVF
ncbi:hypothetical protein [Mesorhizobium escarrei]|uniref:hypothetical protein n=1 Tax=Mesorhizobium escarrei TaxID=666018 RepID=UPI0020A7D85C|nr:hypothetical protein [Mesorhizobium escarrei]